MLTMFWGVARYHFYIHVLISVHPLLFCFSLIYALICAFTSLFIYLLHRLVPSVDTRADRLSSHDLLEYLLAKTFLL